ncbi:MAG: alpha/beta hydrolase [Acidobacteriota bacterium]
MAIQQIHGIKIVYEDIGEGNPLVFIHGHPFNRSMWREQISTFSQRYRVIVPDLRGYGESEVVAEKTMLEDFAQDIAAILDSLKVSKIILAGLSLGGQIVLEFYHLFPQRVHALILADTFAQLDSDEKRQERYKIAERILKEGMNEYAKELLPKMLAAKTIQEQPEVAEYLLNMMRTAPAKGAAAALRGRAERQDYTPLLPQIAVPTLIVVGSEDQFTPVSDAEFMRARIPNSRVAVIEATGHMPNLEKPAVFNNILNEFIKSLD